MTIDTDTDQFTQSQTESEDKMPHLHACEMQQSVSVPNRSMYLGRTHYRTLCENARSHIKYMLLRNE